MAQKAKDTFCMEETWGPFLASQSPQSPKGSNQQHQAESSPKIKNKNKNEDQTFTASWGLKNEN